MKKIEKRLNSKEAKKELNKNKSIDNFNFLRKMTNKSNNINKKLIKN